MLNWRPERIPQELELEKSKAVRNKKSRKVQLGSSGGPPKVGDCPRAAAGRPHGVALHTSPHRAPGGGRLDRHSVVAACGGCVWALDRHSGAVSDFEMSSRDDLLDFSGIFWS